MVWDSQDEEFSTVSCDLHLQRVHPNKKKRRKRTGFKEQRMHEKLVVSQRNPDGFDWLDVVNLKVIT